MAYYLKLWHEARNDAKLASLSDAQFRTWFKLLIFASEQPIRGTIDFESDDYLAVEVAGCDVELLHSTLLRLIAMRCIDLRQMTEADVTQCNGDVTHGNGVLLHAQQRVLDASETAPNRRKITLIHFEKRQNTTREDTAERVRKCRARKVLGLDVTNGNGDVTGMKRGVTQLELELEENSHSLTAGAIPNPQPQETTPRSTADLADVNAAIQLLSGHLDTEPVALEIGRQHATPGLVGIPGWKWLRAAERLLEPARKANQRRSFAYFAGILAAITEADREPKADPKAKATPRESAGQRRQREQRESVKSKAAEMKAKYLAIEEAKTKAKEAKDGH